MQTSTSKWLISAGLSLLWLLGASLFFSPDASAHGTMEYPLSRVYNCYKELSSQRLSEACSALLANGGAQQLYDWNGVRQGSAHGQHTTVVPDGKLCSGGSDSFRGLDLARADWVAHNLVPDANGNIQFVYHATAPHQTQSFQFYVTKDRYDPTKPLAWSDLEATPFCTSGGVPLVDSRYRITCRLPTGKTGRHLIYNIWQRSDSGEAFYSCIDVNFADATGAFPTSVPPTPTPLPTLTPTPTPDAYGCMAQAWTAANAYVADTLVAHNGHTWRAKWWTQGQEPGTTDEWGVWEDRGACSSTSLPPTATPVAPVATATPVAPTATAIAPTATPSSGGSCTTPAWTAANTYVANNLVSHNGRTWRAKWWTRGEVPGTTGQWGVWEDRGACNRNVSQPGDAPDAEIELGQGEALTQNLFLPLVRR